MLKKLCCVGLATLLGLSLLAPSSWGSSSHKEVVVESYGSHGGIGSRMRDRMAARRAARKARRSHGSAGGYGFRYRRTVERSHTSYGSMGKSHGSSGKSAAPPECPDCDALKKEVSEETTGEFQDLVPVEEV